MLLRSIENLNSGLQYSRLFISQRYQYTGWFKKHVLGKMAAASWLESRLVWLQAHLSLLAGCAALVELEGGQKQNAIEWLKDIRGSHSISPVLKSLLKEEKFFFKNEDFAWLVDHKADSRIAEHLDIVNETLAHYTGRSKRLTPVPANTIPELLDMLDQYESFRLDSLEDVKAFVDFIGRREAMHYRSIAGIHYSKDKMN